MQNQRILGLIPPSARQKHLALTAYFIGILLAFAIICFFSNNNQTIINGRVGGDFPAFYSAGMIINSGESERLYDPKTHQDNQSQFLASDVSKGYLIYAYPPFVAVIISPLAMLPYKVAYALYSLLMLGSLYLSSNYLKKLFPKLGIHTFQLFMLSLLFYPILRAVFGGQNTALSLLCFTASSYFLKINKPIKSGLFLGLWMFKIQFALPVVVLFLASKKFKILIGFLPIILIFYLLSTSIGGWYWPRWWLQDGVLPFVNLDQIANLHNFVTLQAFAQRILGNQNSNYLIVSRTVSIGLFIGLWIFWKRNHQFKLSACLALTSCLIVIISPHALYYDAGLTLIAGVFLAGKISPQLYIIMICISWLNLWSKDFPFQPTFLLILLMAILTTNRISAKNSNIEII